MTQVIPDNRTVPSLFDEGGDTLENPYAPTVSGFWWDDEVKVDEGYAPPRPTRDATWHTPDVLPKWWEGDA